MNILLTNCTETLSPGGVNKVVVELGKGLSESGHTVTVLQGNPLKLASEEIYQGFKIVRIKSPLEKPLYSLNGKLFLYLKKHFRQLDPQVIHLHGHVLVTPEVFYTVRRMDRSIPTVVNFHIDTFSGTFGRRLFWGPYTKIDKNVAKTATHIVADSDFEADYIRTIFCVPHNNVSVVHLGVDSVFKQTLSTRRKSRSKEEIRILYVGYLIKRKNVQAILYALSELVHTLDKRKAHLIIVGSGPEKKNLLHLGEQLKIQDHITWKELLSERELVNQYLKADVFVMLSKSEAYGISVAEALSLGTPCIVANATALSEFISEAGCFGVESPPHPQTVARLILHICENEIKVGPVSDKIRTWDQVVREYDEIYRDMMK